MISTSAILPAFVFAATDANRLEKLTPSEVIVILSTSRVDAFSNLLISNGYHPYRHG